MAIAFTLLVLVFLGWSIKKGFNAPVVLALCGAALFAYARFTGVPGMVEIKPDNLGLFYFEKLNAIFSSRLAGLGLLIMSAGGFSAYMTHIGAIDVLIDLALNPLKRLASPYVVGAGVFIIGNFLQMFITSAAGLGILLMAMAFPVLRKLGLSVGSSAGFVVMTGVSEFGPTQANAIFAAEQAKLAVLDYVIQYQASAVGLGLLVTSVVAIFWFKFLDAREPNPDATAAVVEAVTINDPLPKAATASTAPKAPKYYALLTLMPLALLLVFSKYTGSTYDMPLFVAILMSVCIAMAVEFARKISQFREVTDGYTVFVDGMSRMLGVVALIVSAEFFAQGLLSTKTIDAMLTGMQSADLGGVMVLIVSSLLIITASILTGSGNASFLSLGSLAPTIASQMGISTVALVLPMQLCSSIARAMSPISAVVIGVAGIAKISPFALVKRSLVPLAAYIVVVLVYTSLFVL